VLFRLFPWIQGAPITEIGGALYVPHLDQGAGRHDNPDAFGALYVSRLPVSPVAERLRNLLGRSVTDQDLVREGARLSLVAIDDRALERLIDLDDPRNLLTRGLRPSRVATRNREDTQPIALALYREGVDGFEWWSTIEASWINVTLFEDRVTDRLTLAGEPEPLTLDHPAVREAAEAVGVLLSK
jgi:hypothetical protein